MVVDRGGMRYPIEVVDLFTANLQKFRTELAASKKAFSDFRKSSSGNASATRAAARASNERGVALTVEERAQAELNRQIDRAQVVLAKENIAKKKGLVITKRQLEATQNEARVLREVQRIREKARFSEQVETAAKQAGVATSKSKRIALDEERAAQLRLNRVRQAVVAISKRQVASQKEQQQAIKGGIKDQERLEKVRAAAQKSSVADRSVVFDSIRAQGTALRKQGELEQIIEGNRSNARKRQAQAQRRIIDTQKKVLRGLFKTNSAASRLTFTFRRLVGVLALFTAARVGASLFGKLIKGGFEFNQQLETSRFGIAGIITAAGKLTDEQGNVLKGAKAFAAAQVEARKQQQLLRQDALSTTATYQQLLDTFQIATGPGLEARLNLDQIRNISVLISQAASAIGLPQNQLNEEIRSVLAGTIQKRTTRIAATLGITNDDIRNARSQGKLYEFLVEQFKGFRLGAAGAAKTLGGLFVRLKDVIGLVSGRAAQEGFVNLRDALQDVFDALTVTRKTKIGDLLEPNPAAQSAFEAIFDAINSIIQRGRLMASSIGLDGIASAARLLGGAMEIVGTIMIDVFAGVTRGLADISDVFGTVTAVFDGFGDTIIVDGFHEILATVAQIATWLIAIQLTTLLWGRLLKGIKKTWAAIQAIAAAVKGLTALLAVNVKKFAAGLRAASAAALTLQGTLLLIPLAFLAGLVAATALVNAITGGNLGLLQMADIITSLIVVGFQTAKNAVSQFFDEVSTGGKATAKDREIQKLEKQLLAITGASTGPQGGIMTKKFASDLAKPLLARLKVLQKEADELNQKVGDLRAARDKVFKDLDEFNAPEGTLNKILSGQGGSLQTLIDEVKELVRGATPKPGDEGPKEGKGAKVGSKDLEVTTDEQFALDTLKITNRLRTNDLHTREAIQRLEVRGLTLAEREAGAIEFNLANLNDILAATKARNALEKAKFETDNKIDLEKETGEEREIFAKAKLLELTRQQAAAEHEITLQIEEQRQAAARRRTIDEGSVGGGLQQGVVDFGEQFSSSFLTGIEIARSAMQSFSNFISQSISDAFDPNNDTSILERFGQFLQELARMIIQQLVQLAIAKAVTKLFSPAPGFGGAIGAADGGEIPGFHKGGRIPSRASRASMAHYTRPKGLAAGGPPPGISPKDTTPIWAQPGEFMMKVAAVKKYGIEAMAAINAGAIDPSLLRSAGVRRQHTARRGRIGYAVGGEIQQAQQAATAVAATAPSGGIAQGFIVADESAMDRLTRGGARALTEFNDRRNR